MTPTRYALRDVNPAAITICKQGANRKRIFLRKEQLGDGDAVGLPAPHRILKSDDWSVFYCVVAEPDWEEDPGMTGEADSVDVWADASEIRKAAHRLLKNRAYVNAMHDALAEEGCHIVENAVALDDFTVVGPDGVAQTIRKDSWYIAVEPSEAFRDQVESGEITGISLEGDGYRVAIEKAAATTSSVPSKQGTKGNDRANGSTYSKCTSCGAKNARGAKTCKACGKSSMKKAYADSVEQGTLAKIWKRLFPDEDVPDDLGGDTSGIDLRKSMPTFSQLRAERELEEELPGSFDVLRSVIYRAFNPWGDDLVGENAPEPRQVIEQSLDEFKAFTLDLLDRVNPEQQQALAKELATLMETPPEETTVEAKTDTQPKPDEAAAAAAAAPEGEDTDLRKAVTALTEKVDGLVTRLDSDGDGDGEKPPTPAELKKSLDDLTDSLGGKLQDLQDGIDALAAGDSDQDPRPETVRKSDPDRPLAGLLD